MSMQSDVAFLPWPREPIVHLPTVLPENVSMRPFTSLPRPLCTPHGTSAVHLHSPHPIAVAADDDDGGGSASASSGGSSGSFGASAGFGSDAFGSFGSFGSDGSSSSGSGSAGSTPATTPDPTTLELTQTPSRQPTTQGVSLDPLLDTKWHESLLQSKLPPPQSTLGGAAFLCVGTGRGAVPTVAPRRCLFLCYHAVPNTC